MTEADILVVEDDKSIQNFIKITLKSGGYGCILADSGLMGISCFYANHPDLILLDLGLPDMDGMEVLAQVRRDSSLPVIIVSRPRDGTGKGIRPGRAEPTTMLRNPLTRRNFWPASG